MLRVLIDTNVFLVIMPRKSDYHRLFRAFLDEVFELALTNEILTEYEEQFIIHWDEEPAEEMLNLLVEAGNTFFSVVHFRFSLIKDDPDDNKFADCSVAAGADYLITFDKHFNVLKQIDFPKINVVHPDKFKAILNL